MSQLVNEVEAAKILSIAVQTLRNRRYQSRGPNYVKIGRSVRYITDELQRFVDSRTIELEKF